MSAPGLWQEDAAVDQVVSTLAGETVIDLFASAGGWDQGFRQAGFEGDLIGLEWDGTACRTAEAAGHKRDQADVAATDPRQYLGVDGVIASPPCTSWSRAGSKRGIGCASGRLIDEPWRWIDIIRPRWFACEITEDAHWFWRALAHHCRPLGYSVWYGIPDAVAYGTPQNRVRAVVIGRRDGIPVAPPAGDPDRMVSMADALGWGGAIQRSNYSNGGKKGERGERPMTRPAFTVTGKCTSNRWVWPDGASRNWTVQEAGVLQGFPTDYPWQDPTSAERAEAKARGVSVAEPRLQVGNAVPPPMAQAFLTQFLHVA